MRNALLARDVPPQLPHMEHLGVVDPLGHLRSQEVMLDVVEVRLPIPVNDAGLVLHHRLCHAHHGVMGSALWAIAVCTRLEVRCKDGLQDERAGSLDHTVTDRRP